MFRHHSLLCYRALVNCHFWFTILSHGLICFIGSDKQHHNKEHYSALSHLQNAAQNDCFGPKMRPYFKNRKLWCLPFTWTFADHLTVISWMDSWRPGLREGFHLNLVGGGSSGWIGGWITWREWGCDMVRELRGWQEPEIKPPPGVHEQLARQQTHLLHNRIYWAATCDSRF